MLPMLQTTLEDMLEQQAWHMMNEPALYSGVDTITWEPPHERRSGFRFGFCINFFVDRSTQEITAVQSGSVMLKRPRNGGGCNTSPRFAYFGPDLKLRSDFPQVFVTLDGRKPVDNSPMTSILLTEEEEFKMIMWATELAGAARVSRSQLEQYISELAWEDHLTCIDRVKIIKRAVANAERGLRAA